MGYIGKRKDGTPYIQWVDGSGKQRQETMPSEGTDGRAITVKGMEREARRRLIEYEGKALRQKRGLDPLPTAALDWPFLQLMTWWWEQKGKTLRADGLRGFLWKHLPPEIGTTPLREVTTSRLQKLLNDKVGKLSEKSLNHLRGYLYTIYSEAQREGGPWEGRRNPVEGVPRYKVVVKPKKILLYDEWERVIVEVPLEWRGPVACGLYAVLREGEIFGLRKEDVDLGEDVLMICRSWDANRTKDGKAIPVPIAPQLRPYLVAALATAPGPLVFPQADGTMHSRKLRLNRMLRAAIARAGLIEGYEHRCRAARCGWKEQRATSACDLACPRCGEDSLWAKPIPRHVTFHGTRHSGGTAVIKKAGIAVAQKFLRHSDVRITAHTYGHLDTEDVREGLAKTFGGAGAFQPVPGGDGNCYELREPPLPTGILTLAGGSVVPPPAYPPATLGDSGVPVLRRDAQTGRSAASARTRCSSAA